MHITYPNAYSILFYQQSTRCIWMIDILSRDPFLMGVGILKIWSGSVSLLGLRACGLFLGVKVFRTKRFRSNISEHYLLIIGSVGICLPCKIPLIFGTASYGFSHGSLVCWVGELAMVPISSWASILLLV